MDGKKLHENGQEPREFAKEVVDNALRASPEMWLWKAGRTTFVWFATSLAAWLSRTWFDHALLRRCGVECFEEALSRKDEECVISKINLRLANMLEFSPPQPW
jgi:hypothetical protein